MTVGAQLRNPLRTYSFQLKLDDGAPIAGVRKVSGLTMSIQANEIWEGGNSLHRYAQPDRATWEPITLEQGLALDDSLEKWATAAIEFLHTGARPTEAVKRTVVLDVWDPQAASFTSPAARPAAAATSTAATEGEATPSGPTHVTGPRVRSYTIYNAWVSRYEAIPSLDAMGNEVGLLLVELTHEGWKPTGTPTTGTP